MFSGNKNDIVALVCELNKIQPLDIKNFEEYYQNQAQNVYENVKISYNTLLECNIIPQSEIIKRNAQWEYILINFYLLELLNKELSKEDDILSVQQTKNLKSALKNLLIIGIHQHLQPKLPHYVELKTENDTVTRYNTLKCVTLGIYKYVNSSNMRLLFLPDFLQAFLTGVYQLSSCPVKKPQESNVCDDNNFKMTKEFYAQVIRDQEVFKSILLDLNQTIHPAIYIKETMVLFQSASPLWFKKALSVTLTKIIRSKHGVENILTTMLDGTGNDTTKTWEILDVLCKIISSCEKLPDFYDNICEQILGILTFTHSESNYQVYERFFICFTKTIFANNADFAVNILVGKILNPLLHLSNSLQVKKQQNDIICKEILQAVRLTRFMFIDNSDRRQSIPINYIKPIIKILFYLFMTLRESKFVATKNELQEILITYLKTLSNNELFQHLDFLIFDLDTNENVINDIRKDVVLKVEGDGLLIEKSEHIVRYDMLNKANTVKCLMKSNLSISSIVFGYFINCLCNPEKYLNNKRSKNDLLHMEPSEVIDENLEKRLTVCDILSTLAEDKQMQQHLIENPEEIIRYFENVFEKTTQNKTHQSSSTTSDDYQLLFTVGMILQALLEHSHSMKTMHTFGRLIEPVKIIKSEALDLETKNLFQNIFNLLKGDKEKLQDNESNSVLDEAIKDSFDVSIPVKGHGLITLGNLIKSKDADAMKRKQYIANIFQENLKHEDTYIYLACINGLSAMGNINTDVVINRLCEEFSDFSIDEHEDRNDTRMKVGEILVQTSKSLGDAAPKYKALLLNTFLTGTKDEDPLIRASSLSNLGEICRVLGYNLGSIVTEVLVCVYTIITTDKAVEAKRAAVTVIRQLFAGLGKDTLSFLQEDILPIYRSLKLIYTNDEDDVMRLQAQLALEELNENMKEILSETPSLAS